MINEFLRYLVVGGLAFLVDSLLVIVGQERLLVGIPGSLYIATGVGFLAGLAVNYWLTLRIVFRNGRKRAQEIGEGKVLLAFAFTGLIGLGMTELGMGLGTELLGIHYLLVKIGVTAVVLLWNFLARRTFLFRGKAPGSALPEVDACSESS